jgi:hypothetical protein
MAFSTIHDSGAGTIGNYASRTMLMQMLMEPGHICRAVQGCYMVFEVQTLAVAHLPTSEVQVTSMPWHMCR